MSEYERENKEAIEAIELTDQEKIEAIQEAKIKKWFHVKHKPYWDIQEKSTHYSKPNAKPVANIESMDFLTQQ